MDIAGHYATQTIGDMALASPLTKPLGSSVRSCVEHMADEGNPCLHVMDGRDLAGVFTERDVALRVASWPHTWDEPVDAVMTHGPSTIDSSASALDALKIMNERFIRNLPVRNVTGDVVANLSHFDLIAAADAILESHEAPGDEYHPEHALLFISFDGINTVEPLTFDPSTTLDVVMAGMVSRGTGLAMVGDERGHVVGEFTEHDIFTKIACRVDDLSAERLGDWMSTGTATIGIRHTIAEGLRIMAASGHRYLVLTGESGRPSAVLTFRDIGRYIEAALTLH